MEHVSDFSFIGCGSSIENWSKTKCYYKWEVVVASLQLWSFRWFMAASHIVHYIIKQRKKQRLHFYKTMAVLVLLYGRWEY